MTEQSRLAGVRIQRGDGDLRSALRPFHAIHEPRRPVGRTRDLRARDRARHALEREITVTFLEPEQNARPKSDMN